MDGYCGRRIRGKVGGKIEIRLWKIKKKFMVFCRNFKAKFLNVDIGKFKYNFHQSTLIFERLLENLKGKPEENH